MEKKVVSTSKAPAVEGVPYSPAVRIGGFVFISGQIPDDVEADVKTQTRQVLEKVKALVEAAGSKMDNVLKCTVYLSDLNDYGAMNEGYKEYFTKKPPARACVAVAELYNNFKVEIEAIAHVPQ